MAVLTALLLLSALLPDARGGRWSTPTPGLPSVTVDSTLAALSFPSVAVDSTGTLWVVGVVLSPTDPSPTGATLRLWSESHGHVAPPSEAARGVYHKIFFDAEGRLNMVWAEISSQFAAQPTWVDARSRLWISRRSRGGRGAWSAPELVVEATSLFWGYENGVIAAGPGMPTNIVVAALNHDGFATLAMRHAASGWERRVIAPGATYAALGGAGSELRVLVTGLGDSTNRADILLVSSSDGGSSWSAPHRLRTVPLNSASRPRIERAGNRWVATWVMQSDGVADEVHVTSSVDGASWETELPSPTGGSVRRLTLLGASCGSALILAEFRTEVGAIAIRPISFGSNRDATPLDLGTAMRGAFEIDGAVVGDTAVLYHLMMTSMEVASTPRTLRFSLC